MVYYNFWNMELDEMVKELGEENNTVTGAGARTRKLAGWLIVRSIGI